MNRFLLILTLFVTIVFASENNVTKDDIKYQLIINGAKGLDKSKIAKAVGVESKDLFNLFSSKNYIKKSFISNIEDSLKNYLEGIGYFKYKIAIKRYDNNKTIVVNIDPGRVIKVKDIKVDSNYNVKKYITFSVGSNFEPQKFIEIKNDIKNALLDDGYCQYKLDTKAYVDIDNYSAKLKYFVRKGPICHFGKLTIEHKPKDIKKGVILSRVKFQKGDRFSTKLIKNSYNALNSLNTFANIRLSYELDKNSTIVDTYLSLDKRRFLRRYTLSLGYDSEVGIRFKGSWEKRNIWGNAKKFSVSTELSKKVQKLNLNLFAPAIFNIKNNYFDLYSSLGYSIVKTDGYREKKILYDTHLKWNRGALTIKGGIGIEDLDLTLFSYQPGLIGGYFYLVYPYVEAIYDKRDSKIDPKNGYYLRAYSEWGIGKKRGSAQYLKYLIEARVIKSFGDLTLSAVAKLGTIHTVTGYLPASKLFLGGGLFSNRAYSKDEIGVITSNRTFNKLGGKSYFNLQLEANYKIYKKLYGAIFYDRTVINNREYSWSGKHIDTIGFGLRYKTPIGPIKIDVGFNMHNKKDHAISIMLGQSF